jgi:hypothetical protein
MSKSNAENICGQLQAFKGSVDQSLLHITRKRWQFMLLEAY